MKKSLDFLHPSAAQYAELYSSAEGSLLKEISDYTAKHHPGAVMLSGHLQGKLLEMISCLLRPQRVLEIGTFTGYSGLCLARGLAADGVLYTIELREADARIARSFFDRSPLGSQIISLTGDAAKIIPTLDETWDLIFLDADKTSYVHYFNLVFPRLQKNGFILADNIFFHGKVWQSGLSGKSVEGMREFNELIRERTDIEKVVLPVRDGLYLIRKL